jgi:hypothetical protein
MGWDNASFGVSEFSEHDGREHRWWHSSSESGAEQFDQPMKLHHLPSPPKKASLDQEVKRRLERELAGLPTERVLTRLLQLRDEADAESRATARKIKRITHGTENRDQLGLIPIIVEAVTGLDLPEGGEYRESTAIAASKLPRRTRIALANLGYEQRQADLLRELAETRYKAETGRSPARTALNNIATCVKRGAIKYGAVAAAHVLLPPMLAPLAGGVAGKYVGNWVLGEPSDQERFFTNLGVGLTDIHHLAG